MLIGQLQYHWCFINCSIGQLSSVSCWIQFSWNSDNLKPCEKPTGTIVFITSKTEEFLFNIVHSFMLYMKNSQFLRIRWLERYKRRSILFSIFLNLVVPKKVPKLSFLIFAYLIFPGMWEKILCFLIKLNFYSSH